LQACDAPDHLKISVKVVLVLPSHMTSQSARNSANMMFLFAPIC
jgi:hypothetical protein